MMEFLVMPQFTGSLIECYSGSGDGCGCNSLTICICNEQDHSCIGYVDCTCRGGHGPSCTGLRCTIECPVHIGPSSNNPMATI